MTVPSHFCFEYDAANEVFVVRMRGAITDDIFKASYAATPRHVNGRRIRAAVTDLTEVESYDVSAAAIPFRGRALLPPTVTNFSLTGRAPPWRWRHPKLPPE